MMPINPIPRPGQPRRQALFLLGGQIRQRGHEPTDVSVDPDGWLSVFWPDGTLQEISERMGADDE